MEKTQKPVWKIKGANGKYLDSKGWNAEHDDASGSCSIPLYRNGKVVALIVAHANNPDDMVAQVKATADEIIAALNATPAPTAPSDAEPVAAQPEPLSAADRAALGWDDSLVASVSEYRTVAAGDAKCRHLWVVTQIVGDGPGEICTKCGELRVLR